MTIAFGSALVRDQVDGSGDDPAQARSQLDSIITRLNSKFANVTLIQETDLSSNGANGTVAETSGGGFPNVNADVTKTEEDLNTGIIPALVQMYAGSTEPSGWLFCNGQAVSRSTYSDLYNAIGTSFGAGDGSSTFNVPDLRDRSPLGTGAMGATDAGRVSNYGTGLGNSGGEDEHTLTNSEGPPHNHGGSTGNSSVTLHGHGADGADATRIRGANPGNNDLGANTMDNSSHSHSISSDGGGNPHNNMHPFLAVNFIIKT